MNIGIIGLGLMGGSFGRALVKQGEHKIYGLDVSDTAMLKGEMLKAYNVKLTAENMQDLDMLILAVTPDKAEGILQSVLPRLKNGCIVTDFCGIKREIVNLMRVFSVRFPKIVFIGGHPMAGREFSGIEHSSINLFENASMILVNVNADIFTLDAVKKFYLSIGFGNVEICSAELHDDRIAFTSQLCHVVSNAYIKNKNAEVHDGFSAGSYRDMTRVARLNPNMWANLMIDNADNLTNELDQLIIHLKEYNDALKEKDVAKLEKLLAEGNQRKLQIDCNKKD